jgi:predicted nucleotidyltransferase
LSSKQAREAPTLGVGARKILAEVKREVLRMAPGAELLLYGSAARGAQGPESDYDVLVLLRAPLSAREEDRIRDAIYDLELARGVVISVSFVTKERWNEPLVAATPFHRSVEREAIVL